MLISVVVLVLEIELYLQRFKGWLNFEITSILVNIPWLGAYLEGHLGHLEVVSKSFKTSLSYPNKQHEQIH